MSYRPALGSNAFWNLTWVEVNLASSSTKIDRITSVSLQFQVDVISNRGVAAILTADVQNLKCNTGLACGLRN
jgi:hypothetical protein